MPTAAAKRAVDAILSMESYSGGDVSPETIRKVAEVIDAATGLPEVVAACRAALSILGELVNARDPSIPPYWNTQLKLRAALAKLEGA